MNLGVYRRALLELVIVCVIGLVAYEYGVVPAQRSVQQSSIELEQLEIEQVGWGAYDEAREQLAVSSNENLLERVQTINNISVDASEPASLYNQYTQAARTAGIKIERVDPSTRIVRHGIDSPIESSGFNLSVTGPYPAVTSFIEMLQRDFDLTIVENIRMVPGAQAGETVAQNTVVATIETRHYRISRPLVTTLEPASEGGLQ
jgi:hypothetical protein